MIITSNLDTLLGSEGREEIGTRLAPTGGFGRAIFVEVHRRTFFICLMTE
jgi:hypothetical protein